MAQLEQTQLRLHYITTIVVVVLGVLSAYHCLFKRAVVALGQLGCVYLPALRIELGLYPQVPARYLSEWLPRLLHLLVGLLHLLCAVLLQLLYALLGESLPKARG